MKTVTLLGQSYNAGVADAGVTTILTRNVQVADDMTYHDFIASDLYRSAAQDLRAQPGGIDYVAVKNGTAWPMYSVASTSMNDAGELYV